MYENSRDSPARSADTFHVVDPPAPRVSMKRILILGSGGAGKSTLAKKLGERLQIEVIHLDCHYWKPGWVETPRDQWERTVQELLTGDSWIIDGNYRGTLNARYDACDTIIFLDRSRWLCLARILKRRLLHRNATRPDMAPGCPERLDFAFARYIWDYPKHVRPEILKLLRESAATKNVFWLRSEKELEGFLAMLETAPIGAE